MSMKTTTYWTATPINAWDECNVHGCYASTLRAPTKKAITAEVSYQNDTRRYFVTKHTVQYHNGRVYSMMQNVSSGRERDTIQLAMMKDSDFDAVGLTHCGA